MTKIVDDDMTLICKAKGIKIITIEINLHRDVFKFLPHITVSTLCQITLKFFSNGCYNIGRVTRSLLGNKFTWQTLKINRK